MHPPRRTAIMMSRLPRLIDPRASWLCGLRAALHRVHRQTETLVVVDGTAGSAIVRRGAARMAIPLEAVASTLDSTATAAEPDAPHAIPLRDQLLMDAAQMVLALGVRTNGNVHRGLREYLAKGGQVVMVDVPDLRSRAVQDELLTLGALLWRPNPEEQLSPGIAIEDESQQPHNDTVCEIVPFPTREDWSYLSHTTRACAGPWPGTTEVDYLDSLLDGTVDADHSALSALKRILTQQRLIASPRTIRGGTSVVCFTEIPLMDLPNLRQFRTHRHRWDFEPFGLCISRQWLQERGARPVIYGGESTWQNMSENDRPFFQRNSSTDERANSPQGIDWSIEQEWRHPGDIDLSDLPQDQALVFVPTSYAAIHLTDVSRWPITLWPDPSVMP